MIISKSNLYESGWVDLVFAGRNKNYGAYELRKNNARTTNKAMLITFTTVTALIFGLSYVVRAKNTEMVHMVNVDNSHALKKIDQPKDEKIHEMKHTAAAHKAVAPVVANPVPVVTEKPVTVEPKRMDELEKADIGPIDINVPGDGINEPGATLSKSGGGDGTDIKPVDNTIHDYVDVEPEPVGGMAAWNKFLQKNMRYPAQALDAQKGGKVYLSFVVEKDGRITDISVIRGPGYGMDEEATRVLKLAPLWRPGMQHSHAVRVRYTLPFNFQLDQ